MISADGAAGGDYESVRTEILSSVCGISEDKINNSVTTNEALNTSAEKVNTLKEEVAIALDKCSNKSSATDFMKLFGEIPAKYDWDRNETNNLGYSYEDGANTSSGSYHIILDTQDPNTAKQLSDELFETFKTNAKNYLTEDDYEAFVTACDQTKTEYRNYIDAFEAGYYACGDDKSSVLDQYGVDISKRDSNSDISDGVYIVRINNLMDNLMRNYESAGGSTTTGTVNSNTTYYYTVDRNSEEYKTYEAKQAELDAAKEEYDQAVDTDNQALTATEESQIAFYDKIFTAIADNGWEYNSQIDDNDYLNQMLQNNRSFCLGLFGVSAE